MTETPLDIARTWVEFTNPDDPAERFRCDLTWLTSSWTCIFGRGCQGIYAGRPNDGCCTLGAHFSGKKDLKHTSKYVEQLTSQRWEKYRKGHSRKGWTEEEDGATKTRVADGACIFLNSPDFEGGSGCALHHLAGDLGLEAHETKPDVCWQLPTRRTFRTVELTDESSYLEISIGEYDRRGWGPGGHDLDWYCSGNPEAHIGTEPVFRGNEGELVRLMGRAAYDVLAGYCEAHLLQAAAIGSAGPGGRALLPLYVHPATLAAEGM